MPSVAMVSTHLVGEMALKPAISPLECAFLSNGIVTDTRILQIRALGAIRYVGATRRDRGLHQIRCGERGQVSAVAVRHCCPLWVSGKSYE